MIHFGLPSVFALLAENGVVIGVTINDSIFNTHSILQRSDTIMIW